MEEPVVDVECEEVWLLEEVDEELACPVEEPVVDTGCDEEV